MSGALPRDITEAGVGVARLLRADPRWLEAFDVSASGFLRSFAAPVLSLPFVVIVAAMITGAPGDGHVVDLRILWSAGLAQVMSMLAYPAIVAVLVKPLGIGPGYGSFIVVVNWATLLVNIATTAASALLLFGSFDLFGIVGLALFGVSLFVIWRAARETLGAEFPLALMMVVLWFGIGVASERLGQLLTGAPVVG